MDSTERVGVRLSSEALAVLRELVDTGEFTSMSDAVREAVDALIRSRFTQEEVFEIVGRQGSRKTVEFDSLVRDGETSLEDAVRSAVRDMVNSRLERED